MIKAKHSYYRPDIDGLRAIAVLAVLMFHAGVPGFAGGFVGVDMFFVISGYLISGIIIRECKNNTFSFQDFYLRRARRILPALITMVVSTMSLAALVLTAYDFNLLAENVIATILMIPNISIWKTSGDYFAHAVDSNPLLHLWSLGVEEQFYFLFPLLLFLLLRYLNTRWLYSFLLFALLMGLGFSAWAIAFKPTFAFYWLPPRMWELICGALLAYYHGRKSRKALVQQPGLALVGLLMMLLAIVIPRDNATYSDFAHQIFAVVGITLFIDGNTGKNKLWFTGFLTWKPLVIVGLMSYSLYLWHWPLFSLYAYRIHPNAVAWYETVLLLILTFILGYFSWRYVETPFRRQVKWRQHSVAKLIFVIQGMLAAIAIGIVYDNGLPERFGYLSAAYSTGIEDKNSFQKECHVDPYAYDYHFPQLDKCLIGTAKVGAPVSFLVWGDSHANAVTPVFAALAEQYGLKGGHATLFGHAALWGVRSNNDTSSENWMRFNQKQLQAIDKYNIHDVFLVGRWPSYVFSASPYEGSLGKNGIPNFLVRGKKTGLQAFRAGLEETVKRLRRRGVNVWVILPVPEMDRIVPRWLALHVVDHSDVWLKNPYPERAKAILPVFRELQAKYGVHLLDPMPYLCRTNGACRIAHNEKAVYYDDDHLSASGSLLLKGMLKPAFELMRHS